MRRAKDREIARYDMVCFHNNKQQIIKANYLLKLIPVSVASLTSDYLTNKEAKTMYYTVIKHDGNLRTQEKFRKHEPQARVF